MVVLARKIALIWPFNLNDPCAKIGQLAGGEGGRYRLLYRYDFEAVER